MMRMREHGIQDRENSKVYTPKPKCTSAGGGQFITASLIDVQSALYCLAWGMLFAIFSFSIELTFKRYFKKARENLN